MDPMSYMDSGRMYSQLSFFLVSHMSFFLNDLGHENKTGWLGYMGDYTTQLYRDYFINHYKDPY